MSRPFHAFCLRFEAPSVFLNHVAAARFAFHGRDTLLTPRHELAGLERRSSRNSRGSIRGALDDACRSRPRSEVVDFRAISPKVSR